MNNRKESVGGVIKAQASIATSGNRNEHSTPKGKYLATATGPIESLRWLYIKLRAWAGYATARRKARGYMLPGVLENTLLFIQSLIPIEEKWADGFQNLVTTVGKNWMLEKTLAASAYTATWYVGLISLTSYGAGPVVGDTMSSHSGWIEDVEYSQSARPTAVWSTASGGSKSFSAPAVFSINGDGTTIKGCFLVDSSTKSGTSGNLFSAGLFAGGDKVLANGDTLNVSYTATLT